MDAVTAADDYRPIVWSVTKNGADAGFGTSDLAARTITREVIDDVIKALKK